MIDVLLASLSDVSPLLLFGAGVVVGAVATSSSSESSADSVQALLEQRREEIREEYELGKIGLDRYGREVELLEDPATASVMYAVTDVDGVGPATALEIAREYRRPEQLEETTADELTAVNGVGENRARAIAQRLSGTPA